MSEMIDRVADAARKSAALGDRRDAQCTREDDGMSDEPNTADRYLGGRSLNRLNWRRVGGDGRGRPARGIRWRMVTHDDYCVVPMIGVMMVAMVMMHARATEDPKEEASRIGGSRARGQNHRRKNDGSHHFSFALGSRRSVSMMRRLRSSLVARAAISFSIR
jgi:hypothetical protein